MFVGIQIHKKLEFFILNSTLAYKIYVPLHACGNFILSIDTNTLQDTHMFSLFTMCETEITKEKTNVQCVHQILISFPKFKQNLENEGHQYVCTSGGIKRRMWIWAPQKEVHGQVTLQWCFQGYVGSAGQKLVSSVKTQNKSCYFLRTQLSACDKNQN